MTRENLIGAIYDNEEEWSCAYTCPHTMEEENPKEVCWRCAEKQLAEYEQQIRAKAIEDYFNILKDNIEIFSMGVRAVGNSMIFHFKRYAEQLKEQNK